MYLKDFVIVASADVTFLSYKGKSSYNKLLGENLITYICMKKELLTISKFMLCLRLP